MPDLTDAQLDQLITDIGLKDPHRGQAIAPCGTPSAYSRHVRRGEPIDDACRKANTAYKAAQARRPIVAPDKLQPIAHGTLKGYQQHRYRRENACDACKAASAAYQRAQARKSAVAYWAKRGAANDTLSREAHDQAQGAVS